VYVSGSLVTTVRCEVEQLTQPLVVVLPARPTTYPYVGIPPEVKVKSVSAYTPLGHTDAQNVLIAEPLVTDVDELLALWLIAS
jgi:hypothetical protein